MTAAKLYCGALNTTSVVTDQIGTAHKKVDMTVPTSDLMTDDLHVPRLGESDPSFCPL